MGLGLNRHCREESREIIQKAVNQNQDLNS